MTARRFAGPRIQAYGKPISPTAQAARFMVPRLRSLLERLEANSPQSTSAIYIDYRPDARPRYGYGLESHPGLRAVLERDRATFSDLLEGIRGYAPYLAQIDLEGPGRPGPEPFWNNMWVQGLDAASLYCMPIIQQSKTYLEIGSGNSTKFVRRAMRDHGLGMRLISIDPQPRAEIDGLCDETIREPLERTDIGLFDCLSAGDILMFDGSHRCMPNSDVTVFFLEVLPRLKSGVLIYIDDIYIPDDYPPHWMRRFYSEQYLLATLLLADAGRNYEIALPNRFVQIDSDLAQQEAGLWDAVGVDSALANGFWLRKR